MASGSITSWETDVETVEAVRDFILGGYRITAVSPRYALVSPLHNSFTFPLLLILDFDNIDLEIHLVLHLQ